MHSANAFPTAIETKDDALIHSELAAHRPRGTRSTFIYDRTSIRRTGFSMILPSAKM
jgi:hypothetical protein